jgi:hypothetical protein
MASQMSGPKTLRKKNTPTTAIAMRNKLPFLPRNTFTMSVKMLLAMMFLLLKIVKPIVFKLNFRPIYTTISQI